MGCAKGMSGCHRACRHRSFVAQYQQTRAGQEEQRDEAVGTYGEGSEEWCEHSKSMITYKEWLITMKGWGNA